jgi:hypothetical protein
MGKLIEGSPNVNVGGPSTAAATASTAASPTATPEQVQEIQTLIDEAKKLEAEGKLDEAAAKKQEAIDKAIKAYRIDTSQTKGVTYDSSVSGEAVTSPEGSVRVGDEAFRNPAWLGSSIGYESEVHVNQQLQQGKWYTGEKGTALQEVQAYDYEIDNAKRYGTSAADLEDLKQRRNDNYNILDKEYQNRADVKNYDMKPGEEND